MLVNTALLSLSFLLVEASAHGRKAASEDLSHDARACHESCGLATSVYNTCNPTFSASCVCSSKFMDYSEKCITCMKHEDHAYLAALYVKVQAGTELCLTQGAAEDRVADRPTPIKADQTKVKVGRPETDGRKEAGEEKKVKDALVTSRNQTAPTSTQATRVKGSDIANTRGQQVVTPICVTTCLEPKGSDIANMRGIQGDAPRVATPTPAPAAEKKPKAEEKPRPALEQNSGASTLTSACVSALLICVGVVVSFQ